MMFRGFASTRAGASRLQRLVVRSHYRGYGSAAESFAQSTPAGKSSPIVTSLFAIATGLVVVQSLSSPKTAGKTTSCHCQVPCGIFDDKALVGELMQAAATSRKAIVQANSLHKSINSDILSLNQTVRWITTKEEHCGKIISLVSEYCLCQRVKRPLFENEAQYLDALKVHHKVMQAAMKVKQSMNVEACNELDQAIGDLAKMYTK